MIATPGSITGPRPEGRGLSAASFATASFPIPLRSPHILVMDADLAELDRTGRLLSGRGFGITLSSTLLDDSTCEFLAPDLVILDAATVLPAERRRAGERHVLDALLHRYIPIVLCRSGLERGQGTGRPGVAALAKPFHPADFLPAIEALLYWRAEQQRSRSRRGSAANLRHPVASESG
jgi:DNA-binding response OmpR family regulator